MAWLAAASLAASVAVACGGSSSTSPHGDAGGSDATTDAHEDATGADGAGTDGASDGGVPVEAEAAPPPFKPAAHTLPKIPNNGGPVFASPTLVTITYADDGERQYDEDLGKYLVTSPWLAAVGKEYGVGLGKQEVVELGASPATIDDVAIQALILSLIQSKKAPDPDGGAPVPPPLVDDAGDDADAADDAAGPGADASASDAGGATTGDAGLVLMPPVVYMIYFPPSTSVTFDGLDLCTATGGGYHSQLAETFDGQTFAYAVVSACPAQGEIEELLQLVTSHELIEACTDPAQSDPAYDLNTPTNVWYAVGGEVGDLCALNDPQWSEGPYTNISRVYSNASAADGGVPCLPSPEPYYGTDVEPHTFVTLPAGESATFNVTGWSSAPVADWMITPTPYISSPSSFVPTAVLAAATLNNGGKTVLTVTVPPGTPSSSYALILVQSYQSQTDYTSALVGVLVQ